MGIAEKMAPLGNGCLYGPAVQTPRAPRISDDSYCAGQTVLLPRKAHCPIPAATDSRGWTTNLWGLVRCYAGLSIGGSPASGNLRTGIQAIQAAWKKNSQASIKRGGDHRKGEQAM